MYHLGVARRLTWPQREMLIEHIDRARRGIDLRAGNAGKVVAALVKAGLLRYEQPNLAHPKYSFLTPDGKAVACALLGFYADAISRIDIEIQPEVIPLPWREKLAEMKLGRVPIDPVLIVNALTRK